MPASGKMLKNKQQKENRLAGLGDADGVYKTYKYIKLYKN